MYTSESVRSLINCVISFFSESNWTLYLPFKKRYFGKTFKRCFEFIAANTSIACFKWLRLVCIHKITREYETRVRIIFNEYMIFMKGSFHTIKTYYIHLLSIRGNWRVIDQNYPFAKLERFYKLSRSGQQ